MTEPSIDQMLEEAIKYHEAGRLPEAEAVYRRILELEPNDADAMQLLAMLIHQQDRPAEALPLLQKAMNLNPQLPQSLCELGNSLRREAKLDQSIVAFRQAIVLRPDYFEAHNNLAEALLAAGRLDDGIASLRQAAAMRPQSGEIHANLGNLLKDAGRIEESIDHLRQAVQILPNDAGIHSSLCMAMHYDPRQSGADIASELRQWDQRHAQPLYGQVHKRSQSREPDRPLRIGYVSPDFCDHVVGRNILPLLREHDRRNFRVFCYSNRRGSDAWTEEFRGYADEWREIAGTVDEAVADLIRTDRIDILVDLAGHTVGNRLLVFARKPAPVQVTFGGYPGGTGLRAIDYRLSDPYLDPPGSNPDTLIEPVLPLAHSFWCFDPAAMEADAASPSPPPSDCNGHLTFGCLNNPCKLNAHTFEWWSQILSAVPTSRLILLSFSPQQRRYIVEELKIDPARVEFVERRPRREYLNLFHRIDLGLDTFPYNGHTTSLDSLWMGVPVMSWAGSTAVSRAGFSQATNLGIAEQLIGRTPGDLVRMAIKLSNDPARLNTMRSSLRDLMKQSPLTDARRFTGDIESAYRAIWRKWCAGGK